MLLPEYLVVSAVCGVLKLAIKILSGPIATSAIEQNLAVTAGKKYAGQFFR